MDATKARGENCSEECGRCLANRLTLIINKYSSTESRAYSEEITALAENKLGFESVDEACDAGVNILSNQQNSNALRYAALYYLSVLLRHQERLEDLEKIFSQYGSEYEGHKTYQLIYLTFKDAQGITRQSEADNLMRQAQKLRETMPDDAGVQHLYAHIVCSCQEFSQRNGRELNQEKIDLALQAVDAAVELSPHYAKFYATRARLHILKKNWQDARNDVNNAIKLERHNDTSYALHVSNYQYIRALILNEETRETIRSSEKAAAERFSEQLKEVRSNTNSTLEVVGFFAGIIGFIAGSLSICTSTQSFESAARLILVMMGALLVAFTGFSMLLSRIDAERKRVARRYAAVLAIGILAIIGALFI